MFLRARPVSFSSAGPLVPGVAHAPSSLFQAGPHPTGPPLHLLLTHRLTDVRLRRARPLPAARTPSPAHPPDTRSHPTGSPLPPLPQRVEPAPRSFSYPPRGPALEPQSKELRHRSTQSQPPNRPSLTRSHSTVSLVRSANHNRHREHQAQSIRRSRGLLHPSP
jgi:hypothetical protein